MSSSCIIILHHASSCSIIPHRVSSCIILHHPASSSYIMHHHVVILVVVNHHASSCITIHQLGLISCSMAIQNHPPSSDIFSLCIMGGSRCSMFAIANIEASTTTRSQKNQLGMIWLFCRKRMDCQTIVIRSHMFAKESTGTRSGISVAKGWAGIRSASVDSTHHKIFGNFFGIGYGLLRFLHERGK